MRQFSDSQGRTWQLSFDAPTLDAVEESFGISLDSLDNPPWERFASEPRLFVKVLAFVLADQIRVAGTTDAEFRRSIRDGAIDKAALAMADAVIDFFPEKKRSSLKSRWESLEQLQQAADQKAVAMIASPAASAKIDSVLADALGRLNIDSVSSKFPAT